MNRILFFLSVLKLIIYPTFYVLEKNTDKLSKSLFINIANSEGGRKEELYILNQKLDDHIEGIENKWAMAIV